MLGARREGKNTTGKGIVGPFQLNTFHGQQNLIALNNDASSQEDP